MWEISLPHWWEFVLRAVVVYFFLLVLLRLTIVYPDCCWGF